MGEQEEEGKKSPQARISLEPDLAEVLQERAPKKGGAWAKSRFANDCLRAYFIQKGWMPESQEPQKKKEEK